MNGQEYLSLIEQRLERYFDRKPCNEALPFSLIAEMNAADEGYFLVPSIKTYSVQHNEYLYAQRFEETVSLNSTAAYIEYIKRKMQELKTTTEHMSSIFAFVIICENGIDEEALAALTQYKYHKDYCFTLKGWSDLAIFVADTQEEKLYWNKAGQKTASYFDFPTIK